jgi:hypothetical protein
MALCRGFDGVGLIEYADRSRTMSVNGLTHVWRKERSFHRRNKPRAFRRCLESGRVRSRAVLDWRTNRSEEGLLERRACCIVANRSQRDLQEKWEKLALVTMRQVGSLTSIQRVPRCLLECPPPILMTSGEAESCCAALQSRGVSQQSDGSYSRRRGQNSSASGTDGLLENRAAGTARWTREGGVGVRFNLTICEDGKKSKGEMGKWNEA